MRRALTALLCAAVVAAGYGVTRAAADSVYGYTAPGTWFSPGAGYGSPYDSFCNRWVENDFSKAWSYWGLIAFIDSGGGWHDTTQGYGWIYKAPSGSYFTKKLHCKNNSQTRIQGGCYGYQRPGQCA